MTSLARFAAAASVCGFLCAPAVPQEQDQPNTRIQVQVNEVILPVTVTDDKGKFVSNLTQRDFRVYDEGRPQRVTFFSHDQKQPVVVGFLLDMSNATRQNWKRFQDASMELVWNLLPGDKGQRYTGYLISYSNEAELLVNTTPDSDKIADKIRNMKPAGGAALFDAIYMALTRHDLVKGEPFEPRRVIVVIGDGHDSASKRTLDEVIELAQRQQVTIFGMSTMAYGFDNPDRPVLERLAEETGGRVEYPMNTLYKDLSANTYFAQPSDEGSYAYKVGTGGYEAAISGNIIKAVGSIIGNITTQYVLRYVPDVDPEGKVKTFRNIKVEIADLPNVKIQVRKGYYPQGVPGAAAGTATH
jgi:Ca-activated chloride channel homolog